MATQASESKSAMEKAFTPGLLGEIREFWFQFLKQEEHFILPGWEDAKRWFVKDEAFDEACITRFNPILEAIKSSNATAADILKAARPSEPLDWLSLVILLDQVPRNCYRGSQSGIVFRVFDPLAQEISQQAVQAGIPSQNPAVRYRIGYRQWFYMPLMHSEDVAEHEVCVKEFEALFSDIKMLVSHDEQVAKERSPDELICRDVLLKQKEEAIKYCESLLSIEKTHQDLILRFGRYPYRNEPLGRTSSAEEIEYLSNGGETFSS